jgi:hypothetical protein
MKDFRIPVSWQMYGWVDIKAESLKEAAEILETNSDVGLPDGDYVEDSWEIDWEIVTESIDEEYDRKANASRPK